MDKATIKSKTIEAFQKEIERYNDLSNDILKIQTKRDLESIAIISEYFPNSANHSNIQIKSNGMFCKSPHSTLIKFFDTWGILETY